MSPLQTVLQFFVASVIYLHVINARLYDIVGRRVIGEPAETLVADNILINNSVLTRSSRFVFRDSARSRPRRDRVVV